MFQIRLIESAEQLITKVVLTNSSKPFIVNETNIKGTAFKVTNTTDFLIGIQSPSLGILKKRDFIFKKKYKRVYKQQ